MNSVSPFSLLDRVTPDKAADRLHGAARDVAKRVETRARDRVTDTQAPRPDGTNTTGAGGRGGFFNVLNGFDRNDNGRLDLGDAKSMLGAALGFGQAVATQVAPSGAGRETTGEAETPDTASGPTASRDTRDSMAETVIAAGLSGLNVLARTPAQRLALSLAQTTYDAMRAQG